MVGLDRAHLDFSTFFFSNQDRFIIETTVNRRPRQRSHPVDMPGPSAFDHLSVRVPPLYAFIHPPGCNYLAVRCKDQCVYASARALPRLADK
jgi:hypothetical protein